jgi:hypothetical protein
MAKVEIRNEVVFRATTRVGLLADVTEALSDAGVNIHAIGAYDRDDVGEFLMITSNNKHAFEALAPLGGEMDMQPVVVAELPNDPGELAYIAGILAEHQINVSQVFATSVEGAEKVLVVVNASCETDVVKLLEGI